VGLHQESVDDVVECSILLKTEEISAKVKSSVRVTRPWLVPLLLKSCNPVDGTPGLEVKTLDEWNVLDFRRSVEDEGRRYPIVLVSCGDDGVYSVNKDRLLSVVVGLADVVKIPWGVDTHELERIVGRRYIAFGGAINIIFPSKSRDDGLHCETYLLVEERISEIEKDGIDIADEVLSLITHRTNLPYSWRHISPDAVGAAILRYRLAQAIERSKTGNASSDISDYVALLETADIELNIKDCIITDLQADLDASNDEIRRMESDNESLKNALSRSRSSLGGEEIAISKTLLPIIGGAVVRCANLTESLEIISALFPDRVVILESAKSSAKDSERAGFRHGKKAFELLLRLVSDYWQALADGKGDLVAKDVFGQNNYAANEASSLSTDGLRRRTFEYNGESVIMEKHIKYGVKDSVAETLRVHFEWFVGDKKIVIGHCGKHLNF